jgi:hypothetical protein
MTSPCRVVVSPCRTTFEPFPGATRGRGRARDGPRAGDRTLATALAHDDAVRTHFRGGVYWAGLGPQDDVEGAPNRWATALGVEIGAGRGTSTPR